MVTKLTRPTHKTVIQLHLLIVVRFAALAPGGQSGNFWIHPCITAESWCCGVIRHLRTWKSRGITTNGCYFTLSVGHFFTAVISLHC